MRKLIIFAAIGVCTSSSSGEDPEKPKKTSGIISGLQSAMRSAALMVSAKMSERKDKKVRNMALAYVGATAPASMHWKVDWQVAHESNQWGVCRSAFADAESNEIDLDRVLTVLTRPMGAELSVSTEFLTLVHDGNMRKNVIMETAWTEGLRAVYALANDACNLGWLNAWASSVDPFSTCRAAPHLVRNVGRAEVGAGAEVGGEDEDEPVVEFPISKRLIDCLEAQNPANQSRFGRKLYHLAIQVEKDIRRSIGLFALADGVDAIQVALECELIIYVWLLAVVPWYDFSQGSADVCSYFLGVQRLGQVQALNGLIRLNDVITHATRYPEELQSQVNDLVGFYWGGALDLYFSDLFEDFLRQVSGRMMFQTYFRMYLLRPTLVPAGLDFILQYGRPGLFAFFIAAVRVCRETARRYMAGLDAFYNGAPNPHDLHWDYYVAYNIDTILGDLTPPGVQAAARASLENYLMSKADFESKQTEGRFKDQEWSKYYRENLMDIVSPVVDVKMYKDYTPVHAWSDPNLISNLLIQAPAMQVCVSDGQTVHIVAEATRILLGQELRKPSRGPPVPKGGALSTRRKKATVTTHDGHESDDGEEEVTVDRGLWPEQIVLARLVELIDTVVDTQMIPSMKSLTPPHMSGLSIYSTAQKTVFFDRTRLDLDQIPREVYVPVPLFMYPKLEDVVGEACAPKMITKFVLTTNAGAVDRALVIYDEAAVPPLIGSETLTVAEMIARHNPRVMMVDGIERTCTPVEETYTEMFQKWRDGERVCVAGEGMQVIPGCLRDSGNPCLDPVAQNHAWALREIAKHPVDEGTDCGEILAVYAIVFLNSPDAIMNGEPMNWCNALRRELELTPDQTLDGISVLGNKIVGQTKFGSERSEQYIYTLAHYWLWAAVREGCRHCATGGALKEAIGTIESFGGCLGAHVDGFWDFMFREGKTGLFNLFLASMNFPGEDRSCRAILAIAQANLAPDQKITLRHEQLVRVLDALVDGAMQLNQL
jgi:hypothetical protein